jgi:hypothetical protein
MGAVPEDRGLGHLRPTTLQDGCVAFHGRRQAPGIRGGERGRNFRERSATGLEKVPLPAPAAVTAALWHNGI